MSIQINKIKHLCFILRIDEKYLNYIYDNIDLFYTETFIPKTDKNGEPIIDNNGKVKGRTINASIGDLKSIQSRINKHILCKIALPEYHFGGVKGKDNVKNAKIHQGNKYKFVTDMKMYFPYVTNSMVFSMFTSNGFSPSVSKFLTRLTTFKGHVPQGAPTSTFITNLVFVKTGNKLREYCINNGISFSVFVDDLTFSSPQDFKDKTSEILKIITDDGYKISHKKTHYKTKEPVITGIICNNNNLSLPKSFIEKLNDSEIRYLSSGEEMNRYFGLLRYKSKVGRVSKNSKTSK